MGFINWGRDGINWGSGIGNDRYTRTQTPNSNIDLDYFVFDKHSKKWEVVKGKEYHLYDTTGVLNIVLGRFASMFSNGRFVHKKKDGTVEGKVIEDSPYIFLLDKPNPLQSGKEFMMESALHYWIYGNNLINPFFKGDSDLARSLSITEIPAVINNITPQLMELTLTGKRWDQTDISGIIEKYTINPNTDQKRDFKPTEIIHIKRTDPNNPILGKSVFNSLHMEISNIRAAMGFRNVNLTEHGETGFYSPSGKDAIGSASFNPAQRLEIDKELTKTHGQFRGQARKRMFNVPVDYTHTAYPMSDAMTFEEISEDMKKVIDALNLNDNIFSKEKSKVQANLDSGNRMAYQDAIIPFSENYCEHLTMGLGLPDGEWLELDYSHIPALQDNEKDKSDELNLKANAVQKLKASGVYTDAEIKNIVGLG